jgi:hypothetical protein
MAKPDTLHVVETVSLVERLFSAEEGLRSAALFYGKWESASLAEYTGTDLMKYRNHARSQLREAALKYAEIAKLVSP